MGKRFDLWGFVCVLISVFAVYVYQHSSLGDPEFKRSLQLNLTLPEIHDAVAYYNWQGVPTGVITQKQLNDYVAERR